MWQTTTYVCFYTVLLTQTWLFADARRLNDCMQNNKRLVEKDSQVLHLFYPGGLDVQWHHRVGRRQRDVSERQSTLPRQSTAWEWLVWYESIAFINFVKRSQRVHGIARYMYISVGIEYPWIHSVQTLHVSPFNLHKFSCKSYLKQERIGEKLSMTPTN